MFKKVRTLTVLHSRRIAGSLVAAARSESRACGKLTSPSQGHGNERPVSAGGIVNGHTTVERHLLCLTGTILEDYQYLQGFAGSWEHIFR